MFTEAPSWVAEALVRLGIVRFAEHAVFFKSGIRAPMYIDCRMIVGMTNLRSELLDLLEEEVRGIIGPSDIIAGVAMGAVPLSAIMADHLERDYCYVRLDNKDRGTGASVNGADVAGQPVLLFEDVVTMAETSAPCIKKLREHGARVEKIVSLVSYDFPAAAERFQALGVTHHTLVPFKALLLEMEKQFPPEQVSVIRKWHRDPHAWSTT
ncbi:MAG: hypothetical protein KGJ34_02980 [Patescibacteria group bacterium]|nr:hypothetical protein [Patescibacteria group bacterium]